MGKSFKKKSEEDGKSDIKEDLALSSRAQGKSALPTGPDCLSTEEIKKNGTPLFGTLLVLHRTNARSSGTAEERDEGMALKIRQEHFHLFRIFLRWRILSPH